MDKELLEQMQTLLDAQMKAIQTTIDTRIDTALKALETAPAVRTAGVIAIDGGETQAAVKSFADFTFAVRRGDHKRLERIYGAKYLEPDSDGNFKALAEGSGEAGGYTVPVEYETGISKIAAQMDFIEPLAFGVPMASAEKKIPLLSQTNAPTTSGVGASGYFGGMYFTMDAENAEIDEREPEFDLLTLRARDLNGFTAASNQWREDSPFGESELMTIFAQGLSAAKQYLFLKGDGVGKPLGMLHAANPARLTVSRAGSGNDIDTVDVTKMLSRMIPALLGNAIWTVHPYGITDLLRVSLVTNGDPAFIPATNQAEGSPLLGTLLSRPVYASEYMAPLGSAGDLALIAPRAYAIGTRRGMLIAGSEHYRFNRNQYTWRITSRFDAKPRINGTFKLADGSNNETAAFVVLS